MILPPANSHNFLDPSVSSVCKKLKMGCISAIAAFIACILQWPSRRILVLLGMGSYLFWIAVVHHQASTWMRADILAVAEFIAPFEMLNGPKAAWISFANHEARRRDVHQDIEPTIPVATERSYNESNIIESENRDEQEDGHVSQYITTVANETSIGTYDTNLTDTTPEPVVAMRLAANDATISSNLTLASQSVEPQSQFSLAFSDTPECSPLRADELAFTLVTQCDDERVELVAQHCLRWTGPLSVAVYSSRSAEEIKNDIVALGCIRDQLHVATLNPLDSVSNDYPVNHLRNLALGLVETSHLVYMDIDFLPSSDLESTLESDNIQKALIEDHKHALVIPAFEYKPACQNCSTQEELLGRMPRTRDELMRLHDEGEASMFHEYWPVAHDSTDYAMWKHQAHGSLLEISCIRSNHYEPYLIIRKCAEMPPFQEAFKNYGYNKASFTMQLQAMQYRLSQVGGIFCTHFPHAVSKARQLFDQDKSKKTGPRLEIAELVKNYTRWLDQTYGHNKPSVPNCKDIDNGGSNQGLSFEVKAAEISPEDHQDSTPFLQDSPALGVCNDITPEEVSYSLVTQCSDDRLWIMEHHCRRWGTNNTMHAMSLVVYTNDTLSDTKQKLMNLGCPVDNGMTVQVFPQVYEDKDYPVNDFRNRALEAVNTTHAVFLDVDFWISSNLYSTLNEPSIRNRLSESVQNAMVVPAFQLLSQCKDKYLDCPDKHIPMMPDVNDDAMQANIDSGEITVFNVIHNRDGHGSTRYDLWATQQADQLLEIDCVKSNRYEPYLVVRVCNELPPLQPVWKGFGKNKISWILHLRRLGWRFFQMGQGFVIHYPHKDSKAKRAWKGGSIRGFKPSDNATIFEDSMRSQNDQLFVEFRQWLAESVPNRTKIHKCTDDGVSQDDDAALWVTRDEDKPVAF